MRDKNKLQGIIGTLVLHAVVLLVLLFVYLHRAEKQEESGVPVMLGEVDLSQGDADPYTYTPVEAETPPPPEAAPTTPSPASEAPLITQEEEPSLEVKKSTKKESKKETKKETPKEKKETTVKETAKKTPTETKSVAKSTPKAVEETPKPKEKSEAEKRAEEEAAAAAAAQQRIAGAFGKGTSLGSKGTGTSGTGIQGSSTGNSSAGKSSGVGGYGTFDLNGRSLGQGGLPRPSYNVQEEGRVVVTITVNPEGVVIGTSINKRTDTMSAALRKAAEEAARKARFNKVDGADNQTGTITYYFKLK